MLVVTSRYSSLNILLRVADALLPPAAFVAWYRANELTVGAQEGAASRPGLIVSALMMVFAARALLRVEVALRTPWMYQWNVARLARWFGVFLVMAFGARLLR